MAESPKEWFSEWFNSPFYHILYKHRDFDEAERFINNLGSLLQFKPNQTAQDIGCGRGRHSVYLNSKGLVVDGLDLSDKNIEFAKQFENSSLHFYVHDMRNEFRNDFYNYVFNLFTSFGYFDQSSDDLKSIKAFANALKENGILVIDFLNPVRITKGLVPEEVIVIDGIEFHITRVFEDGYIFKNIRFDYQGENYFFQEKVKALSKDDFALYFSLAGVRLEKVYGNYSLDEYNENESDRMIFIARKTK